MAADLISIFHRSNCSSGFISHLYQHELRHLYSEPSVTRPVTYRLSPTSYLELPAGATPGTTLSQSFKTKLDNLLNTIHSSQPHFVLCVKPSRTEDGVFDPKLIATQCRGLSMLETCHVMSDGMPHRLRVATFYSRYWVINKDRKDKDMDMAAKCSKVVSWLKCCLGTRVTVECVVGLSHVSYSEGTRQLLERLRTGEREEAARRIQSWWRRRTCDVEVILQTISLHGLDKVTRCCYN